MSTGNLTRRELLVAGVGLTGSALFFGAFGLGIFTRLDDARHLREATYRPLVGDVFRVVNSGHTVDLKLTGVRNLGPLQYSNQLVTGREHFALDFKGPVDKPLQSSMHTLTARNLGPFQLFVSPVGRTDSVQRYEAIVNRYEINVGRNVSG
jgi:hypothetical protein